MTSVAVSKSLRFQPLRRSFLRRNIAFALGSVAAPMIGAQTLAGTMAGSSASPSPMVAQVIDMSSNQQDVSKDFVVGARATSARLIGSQQAPALPTQPLCSGACSATVLQASHPAAL
jgi:hypothetical protein